MVDGKPRIQPMRKLVFQEDLMLVEQARVKFAAPKPITSASFKKRAQTGKWDHDDTRKFYKLLEIFGSDFSMIATLFKNRTRMQIKVALRFSSSDAPRTSSARRNESIAFRSTTR